MALTFVQKISATGTSTVSFVLPVPSTAGNLLVAEVASAAATVPFTPPAGAWVLGPSIGQGTAVRVEQWSLPLNPGGLATAGTPLVFTGGTGGFIRATLTEWSSAAGTTQTLVAYGTNSSPTGSGLTVTCTPGSTTGAIAVANIGVAFGSSQSISWTGPAGWTADATPGSGALLAGNWRETVPAGGGAGGFASLIGAAGNDPTLGCPTSIAGFNYANNLIGPLNAAKLFYSGALPTSIANGGVQGGGSPNDLPAGVVPIICYNTPDTNVTSFVNSVQRPVILVWQQEAEASGYTYANFKTIFQRQSTTIRAAGNPLVQVAMCSIGYQYHTGVNADATAGRWIVPGAYVDLYLQDLYQHYDNGGTGYAWPSTGLSNWDQWLNWVNVVKNNGKPLGIAEYGIDSQMSGPPANDTTCAARTARITADATYLDAAFGPGGTVSSLPMACWLYWYSNCSAGVLTTDLRHNYQFPSTETGSVTAWKGTQTALSATASETGGTGVTGWAGAIAVYGEAGGLPPVSPAVTTTSLPAATTGVSYSQTLTETSGTAPFAWSITTGALPDGLTLDPGTGIISGVPTMIAATSGFTVTVTDGNSLTGSAALFITVVTGLSPPPAAAPNPLGFPQVIIEAGFPAAAPQVPAGTFILDDPVYGKLDSGNKLADSTQWTDIAAYFRTGSISRPSTRVQGPLVTWQGGTATGTFDNTTGALDPDNSTGPYFGFLRPMVPFQIRAVYGSVSYPMWAGFTSSLAGADLTYDMGYDEVTITADDGFKILAGVTIPAVPASSGGAGDGEDTGTRVDRILNAAGWYTDHRRTDTGDTVVQATFFGDTALNLLQLTADNEIGSLYMDGAGNVVFRHRHALLTDTRSATVQAVFGDLPGTVHGSFTELACIPHRRADDDTQLANDIQATTAGGTPQEAQNKTSQRTYLFPRSYPRTDLILEDDPTTLNWAQWVLAVSLAEDRFDSVTIDPLADPANLFPQVLARDIGDRIQVWRRPQNSSQVITQDCLIRGIQHDVDAVNGTWSTTWYLQNAAKYTGFLILDDAVKGLLNTGKLAF